MRLSILLAILPAVLAAPAIKRDEPAPIIRPGDPSELVPNQYIVKFKDGGNAASVRSALKILSEEPDHVFTGVFDGFSAKLDKKALTALQDEPDVEFIEQDSKISIKSWVTQKNAEYGLARLASKKTVTTDYIYDSTAGTGTCAYVIDTGIEATHPEFDGGRAKQIKSFIPGQTVDGNGHGTHVAGTIGGKVYGVSKKIKIFGVKVLDDSGSGAWSDVIAGFDFVIQDSKTRKASCPKGFFVNISLGGLRSEAVNAGAAALVKAGLFTGVAASNDSDDAKNYSPASEPTVCTVGAVSKGPSLAYYSNYGSVIDIFAVGTDVTSAWIGGTYNTISGTSMATPHIVGLAAYYASKTGNPSGLCTRMRNVALNGAIKGLPAGTVNKLAYNGAPYK